MVEETIVWEAACEKAEEVKVDEDVLGFLLGELYGGPPVCILENATAQDWKRFNAQYRLLLDRYRELVNDPRYLTTVEIDRVILDFCVFETHITGPKEYYDQLPKFYQGIKYKLECILVILPRHEKLRVERLVFLASQLVKCPTGVDTTLEDFQYELMHLPSITAWLADMRRNIVIELEEEHIAAAGVQEDFHPHVSAQFHIITEALLHRLLNLQQNPLLYGLDYCHRELTNLL